MYRSDIPVPHYYKLNDRIHSRSLDQKYLVLEANKELLGPLLHKSSSKYLSLHTSEQTPSWIGCKKFRARVFRIFIREKVDSMEFSEPTQTLN